jgi:hypothetical protein
VERVDDFKNDDDWQVGHHLLIYIVNVAHSIQKR